MNIFTNKLFKINYNSYLNRVSIQNVSNYLNILEPTFNILLTIIRNKGDFSNVSRKENNVVVEIIKLNNNVYISSTNKSYFESILIENEILHLIKLNLDQINQKIEGIKTNKKRKSDKNENDKKVKKQRQNTSSPECEDNFTTKNSAK